MQELYQNIEGENLTYEDEKRKDSNYWNEGKWRNFIQPLLPKGRMTFTEIGCNSGLLLKLAKDNGFTNVIGFDSSKERIRSAIAYRDRIGYDYKIYRKTVGVDLSVEDIPLSDVILIANTHYYFGIPTFSHLVDDLKRRCGYCLIVSAKAKRRQGNALYDLRSVRGYFGDWEEVGFVPYRTFENDPAPREHMYGVLFKGNVRSLPTDMVYDNWLHESLLRRDLSASELPKALQGFIETISEDLPLERNPLYEYYMKCKNIITEKNAEKYIAYKKSLVLDIMKNGINEPVYFDSYGKLLDGAHRLSIAKFLGLKTVFIRII